jgi:hypothetical protein
MDRISGLVIRALIFLVTGAVGWSVGGILGFIVGIPIESLLNEPPQPGATYYAFSWGAALLGSVVGLCAAIIWTGVRLGRDQDP